MSDERNGGKRKGSESKVHRRWWVVVVRGAEKGADGDIKDV